MIAILTFIVSFYVYLSTSCPTLYIGDNGELVTTAYVLGISHPPGYSLFCIIGKIASIMIPVGDIALRVNIINSLLASFSIVILYNVFKLIALKNAAEKPFVYSMAGASAALIFGFSKTFWSQVVVAEVYVINIFIIVFLFYILLLWERKCEQIDGNIKTAMENSGISNLSSATYFYLFIFVYGIGIMNHYMVIYLSPVFFVYIYLNRRLLRISEQRLIIAGAILFLSLSIYLYMPIRALANPILNWGDPTTFLKMKKHILREQYGPISKNPRSISLFVEQFSVYFKYLFNQFTPYLIILVPIGAWFSYLRNKKHFWMLLSVFIMESIILVFVLNYKMDFKELYMANIFFITSYIIASIWLGFGLIYVFEKIRMHWRTAIILGLIPLLPLITYYKENDKGRTYFAYDYGINLLSTMEPNSVLFTSGDNPMFILAYLTMVRNMRPDIKIYDDFGCVFENIYGEDFLFLNQKDHDQRIYEKQKQLIERITDRQIYYSLGSFMQKMPGVASDTIALLYLIKKSSDFEKLKPRDNVDLSKGRSSEINLKNLRPMTPLAIWKTYKIGNIDNPDIIAEDYLGREISARYYFAKGEYFRLLNRKSDAMKEYGKAAEISEAVEWVLNNLAAMFTKYGWIEEALKLYRRIIEINPKNAIAHNNYGVTLLGQGKSEEAMEEFKTAIKLEENYADAHNNLGNVYYKKALTAQSDAIRKTMTDVAKDEFSKAINSNPNHSDAWSNLGDIFLDQKDEAHAIDCYNKVLAINPMHIKSMLNLGGAYFKTNQLDKAMEIYKRILEFEPNSSDAYNNIGVIYGKLERYDEAVKAWQKALSLNPNHKDALINMNGIRNMRANKNK